MDWMDALYSFTFHLLVGLGFVYLVLGLDDLFIDLIACLARLKPKCLSNEDLTRVSEHSEKTIAIIIPAWNEGSVIGRMLAGNEEALEYRHHHFFVGVYPNDPQTLAEVKNLSMIFPNIHGVMNDRPGPTSKGQILNRVIQFIFGYEMKNNLRFDGFLMQDAEDLMHPKILKLMNVELEKHDFIQAPIFSLKAGLSELVAGTYMDEFAESHTKDILVRSFLGVAVPSAGVGTALSRSLVMYFAGSDKGGLFNEKSLTEDYELGIRAHRAGFKSHFSCFFYTSGQKNGKREYIATRECFPKSFRRSIKQKTRWSTGICLQGWRNLGWPGNVINRYFLWRDRKGILANLAVFLGYPGAGLAIFSIFWAQNGPTAMGQEVKYLFGINFIIMLNRFFQRVLCTFRIYGFKGVITIPFRWPIAIVINAIAAYRAVKNDRLALRLRVELKWEKTEHELPQYFGIRVPKKARLVQTPNWLAGETSL